MPRKKIEKTSKNVEENLKKIIIFRTFVLLKTSAKKISHIFYTSLMLL